MSSAAMPAGDPDADVGGDELYCESCRESVVPGSPGGECPHCGGELTDADAPPRAPWHFKVLLVGTAGYLVYRLIWFIFWLTGHGWNG
jgi:hypothetical protein